MAESDEHFVFVAIFWRRKLLLRMYHKRKQQHGYFGRRWLQISGEV